MSEIIIDGQRYEGMVTAISRELDYSGYNERITLEVIVPHTIQISSIEWFGRGMSPDNWTNVHIGNSVEYEKKSKKQYKGIKFYKEK